MPPSQEIIRLQSEAIEGNIPSSIARQNKSQVVNDMGSIMQKPIAFPKGFHHQTQSSLAEIAHAAVNQLGAAAGSAGSEVRSLEQKNRIPPGCGIHCNPSAGGTPTNYDQIPDFTGIRCLLQHLGSVHENLPHLRMSLGSR